MADPFSIFLAAFSPMNILLALLGVIGGTVIGRHHSSLGRRPIASLQPGVQSGLRGPDQTKLRTVSMAPSRSRTRLVMAGWSWLRLATCALSRPFTSK